jgi:hypothetical protein
MPSSLISKNFIEAIEVDPAEFVCAKLVGVPARRKKRPYPLG